MPGIESDAIANTAAVNRWRKAQSYERAWWNNQGPLRLDYLRNMAVIVEADLAPFGDLGEESRVVEIGSGPAGIVTFLPGSRRCGVEPLEDYFGSVEEYVQFRDPQVEYVAAQGEALPFDDASFDLALSDNVLDHVEDPGRVLAEIHRVLAPGGRCWLRVHSYHTWGRFVRRTIERFEVDHGHPHTFTHKALLRIAQDSGFAVLHDMQDNRVAAWRRDLTAGRRKELAQALLFTNRANSTFVLKRM